MEQIIWPDCLYNFLRLIKSSPLEKKILDCGAGGRHPPLVFFNNNGYQTYGIDISQKEINLANKFASENDFSLNIRFGDMRKIPFEDHSFSFVYTQNSLCHLNKNDIQIAISEIMRVLVPEGICLIDFMSIDSSYCNEEEMGTLVGDYEFKMDDGDESDLHSFYCDNEPDKYFLNFNILRKDKVITELFTYDLPVKMVNLYYYVQKNIRKKNQEI